MHRVIDIDLEGQATAFRLHEDAYDALRRYLDQARARLDADPDRAEVIGDLERSIGAKLADRLGAVDRVLAIADIDAVLAAVGPVGAGDDRAWDTSRDHERPGTGAAEGTAPARPGRRRLYRIREGEQFAGVCTGLAAYSQIRVDWVRAIFVLLALVTVGGFLLVYLVLAFALPVVPTQAAWLAAQEAD